MPRGQVVGRRRGARGKRPSRGGFRASGLDTFTRLAGIEGATLQAAEAGATVLAPTDVWAVDSAVRPGEQEAAALVGAAFLAAGGVPLFAVGAEHRAEGADQRAGRGGRSGLSPDVADWVRTSVPGEMLRPQSRGGLRTRWRTRCGTRTWPVPAGPEQGTVRRVSDRRPRGAASPRSWASISSLIVPALINLVTCIAWLESRTSRWIGSQRRPGAGREQLGARVGSPSAGGKRCAGWARH